MRPVSELTLPEKIGQLFVFGFDGTAMNPYLREMITEWKVGGFVFSIRNVENPFQVRGLIADMQALALESTGIPLIITINQEGGDRTCFIESLSRNPGSMAIGATHESAWAYRVAYLVGTELRALGFNMLYMPVLDLSELADNSVLGIRAFGDQPHHVAAMGRQFIRGLKDAGMASTAKHFPGAGGSAIDAHFELPTINSELEELLEKELIPFQAAIEEGVSAIMTSHTRFPRIDSDALTTFSRRMITELAREKLGFDGVVTSDAFGMKGLINYFDPRQAAIKVFEAGADTILKRHGRQANYTNLQALTEAVEQGTITEARLDESLTRIFRLKESYCQNEPLEVGKALWNSDHSNILEELGNQSVTLVRNEDGLLPMQLPNRERVLIIMPDMLGNASLDGTTGDMAGYIIRGLLSERYAYDVDGFDLVHFGLDPYVEEIEMIVERARDYDILIVGGHRANVRAHQAEMIHRLFHLGKPTIIIALNSPYDLLEFPEVGTYICTYGERLPQLKALCGIISGDLIPAGRLPVAIGRLHQFGEGITSWK